MLYPNSQASLNSALEYSAIAADLNNRLTHHLSLLAEILDDDTSRTHAHHAGLLSANEAAHLLQLNRHLAKTETFQSRLPVTISPVLGIKVANPADSMSSYEIDTSLHDTLREYARRWCENSVNILTQREEWLKSSL